MSVNVVLDILVICGISEFLVLVLNCKSRGEFLIEWCSSERCAGEAIISSSPTVGG